MSAILRVALAYFSIVPLQKWMSIAGVMLLTGALFGRSPAFAIAAFLGAFFVVFVPLLMGGASMRVGSSRSALQLRPGARWKMLAAALLTVSLMAATCVFAFWMATRSGMGPPRGRTAEPVLTTTQFAIWIWGVFGLIWLVSFVASASRKWTLFIGISFVTISGRGWAPLSSIGSPPLVLAGAAALAWVVFALWYLNVRQVGRTGWTSTTSPMGMGESNTGGWYSSLTESRSQSRAVAIKAYLLGTTSQIGFLLPGILSALFFLPLYLLQRRNGTGVMLPVAFLIIFSGIGASLSYMVARRARMLWLRAGLDRSGLFALGERTAVQAFAQMVIIAALVLGLFSIVIKPDMGAKVLLYVVAQLAYATVLFYFGLSRTRPWTAAGIAGCFVLGLGLIVQVILLAPQSTGIPLFVAPVMTGFSVLLAVLLRQHAKKRWLTVDWHLTRPPAIAPRAWQ